MKEESDDIANQFTNSEQGLLFITIRKVTEVWQQIKSGWMWRW